MALVRLVEIEELDGEARQVADAGRAQYGQLLNTWRAIMHRPPVFAAYLPFVRAVAGPGELDPKLKDLSAVLVGLCNHCRYTVSHRTRSALANGVTVEELEAVAAEDWGRFDEPTRTALRFTEQLTLQPPQRSYRDDPHAVDADTIAAVRRHFTDAQLVELAMSVSLWNALARFHRVMDFALDMPAPPPALDPAASASDATTASDGKPGPGP